MAPKATKTASAASKVPECKEKRIIKTKLISKEELFYTLALAECTQLPVLLVGPPGVAKTAALIDYASAMVGYDKERAKKEAFIIELDESTKSSEVKGRVDLKKFMEDKEYKIHAPIVDAKYILINEVDKGSSAIRNAMLSIMRERRLFLGAEIKKCEWKIFAGSCNVIPGDEISSPFWDRFIIKLPVDRVPNDSIIETWGDVKLEVEVPIPSKEEIAAVSLNSTRMKIFSDTIYKSVSDRTLTFLPLMVSAVKLIWRLSEINAIIKVCNYIAPSQVNSLSGVIEDARIVTIKNELQMIGKMNDVADATSKLKDMITTIGQIQNSISDEDTEELMGIVAKVANKRVFKTTRHEFKEVLDLIKGDGVDDSMPEEEETPLATL